MSRLMGKPTICICENKDADQLRGNREADQCLCFRYSDSTIPLLLKSEIPSFYFFSVLVQLVLCRTCSETTLLVFPRSGSNYWFSHDTAQFFFVLQVLDREVQQKMKKFEELVKEVGYEALLSFTSENNFFPRRWPHHSTKIFLYTLRDTVVEDKTKNRKQHN